MSNSVFVTATGRTFVTGRLGSTSPPSEPKDMGWGTANSGVAGATVPAAAKTDVAPFNEAAEARISSTTSSQVTSSGGTTNDTYQVVGTLTSASSQTIAEVFLTDSTTKAPATTLTATLTSGATSMSVASATGFPGSGTYYVQIEGEVVAVTGGQGTTTWTITRGANGSTAAAHSTTNVAVTAGNIPGSTTIVGGNVACHATFTGLALNANDSLASTVQITFS